MAKKDKGGAAMRARVLVQVTADGVIYAPDTVIEATADAIARLAADGSVDPHPDAVAYAESLSG